jgi:hypothetical protein
MPDESELLEDLRQPVNIKEGDILYYHLNQGDLWVTSQGGTPYVWSDTETVVRPMALIRSVRDFKEFAQCMADSRRLAVKALPPPSAHTCAYQFIARMP